MDTAVIVSRATLGMRAPEVTVETHISRGIPGFSIVGLPETAVKESRDRVRSAIINSHFEFPAKKITVNLAPADLPKYGSRFDLPIALSILAADNQINSGELHNYEFAGELALTGELRPLRGILPFAMECKKAHRWLMVPNENAAEASLLENFKIFAAESLIHVCAHLNGFKPMQHYHLARDINPVICNADLRDVQGQLQAKRALEIAAAGAHSLLLFGPPGTGKSMLASRLPGILPGMMEHEALEAAAIASISSQGFKLGQWKQRPFRSPHHSASSVALVGGGSPPRPGEISLAHRGVLFLDELPEFGRNVLEAMREPLESGYIMISRAAQQAEFPAKLQLIAAMNPCPCGYLGDPDGWCNCTREQIQKYRSRISGPLLDRIDMHLEVTRISDDLLTGIEKNRGESSAEVKTRVEAARKIQWNRNQCTNAELNSVQMEKFCGVGSGEIELLQEIIKKMRLSARAYYRILKVSRTIADLGNSEKIAKHHIMEAVNFRSFDRHFGK